MHDDFRVPETGAVFTAFTESSCTQYPEFDWSYSIKRKDASATIKLKFSFSTKMISVCVLKTSFQHLFREYFTKPKSNKLFSRQKLDNNMKIVLFAEILDPLPEPAA